MQNDLVTSAVLRQLTYVISEMWWVFILIALLGIARSAWFKGHVGEWIVNFILRFHFKEPDYKLFKDVLIPNEDGTTQIDHILVSRYGIFVIETKNMRGWIFGSEQNATWTQVIYKKKTKFQNPLRQNYKHTQVIENLLQLESNVVNSVVVFTGDTTFKTELPENVLHARWLKQYIKSFDVALLSNEQLNTVSEVLAANRLVNTLENKRAHIAHIREIRSNQKRPEISAGNCPRCGSELVAKVAKRGANRGNSFLGCSSFPKCRYIQNL